MKRRQRDGAHARDPICRHHRPNDRHRRAPRTADRGLVGVRSEGSYARGGGETGGRTRLRGCSTRTLIDSDRPSGATDCWRRTTSPATPISVVSTAAGVSEQPVHHRVSPDTGAGFLCLCIGHSALGPWVHVQTISSADAVAPPPIWHNTTGVAAMPATWPARTANTSTMSRRRITRTSLLVKCGREGHAFEARVMEGVRPCQTRRHRRPSTHRRASGRSPHVPAPELT